MRDSRALLVRSGTDFPPLRRRPTTILQVNLGYRCNLSCVHCHVNAGPTRTEMMSAETADLVIEVLRRGQIETLDLTGGAPEMSPHFRRLVREARALGVTVIDRCNLTILLEPGYEDLPAFLADQGVQVVASLPCYLEENVNKQRGKGVYAASIEAIRRLNRVGYGGESLILDLVYNPVGAHLPPPQAGLQEDYKRELAARFDIHFNRLLTITNMPISRFGAVLLAHHQFDDYMQLLRNNHNPANLDDVMCRNTLSVDYQGYLYDCDFNQMLGLAQGGAGRHPHLREMLQGDKDGEPVYVADHCFGCTAGAGSSCGGALA
ncbi:putative L-asparaginase II [Alloalcanivorax dieselolei B5]|uniref:Putative L-asparaginase II n=1 Tax=Alcanivorax dieselolei (strain DSM 16502 / CGMCC 1.3690 / MCCC 1A00001 / B-5) TaxID=930169 RepID=K0CIL4_ALCDB|nr:arsenosugar biosynthesis radical SAM (seleno)protein ArsS [Alloalcanivorax dieselolei]AFT71406.1 putative L-asparaginase II [Alloalcanivorax dieselolei B5]GGK08202.1 radical SAM/Cys-rich domain protein [Alloalcanivorax dieselolei]